MKPTSPPAYRYPSEVIASAYNLYMESVLTNQQIAEKVGVSYPTINSWIHKNKWGQKRQELTEEMQINVDIERRHIVMKNLTPVIKRHLKVTDALENATLKIIKKGDCKDANGEDSTNLSSKDISDLGKGLNQSAAVSARVVGIDKSSAISVPGLGGVSAGAGSLINIGVMPLRAATPEDLGYDPAEQAKPIDVECDAQPPEPLTDFPEA